MAPSRSRHARDGLRDCISDAYVRKFLNCGCGADSVAWGPSIYDFLQTYGEGKGVSRNTSNLQINNTDFEDRGEI